ncbi:MAG: cell division protein ZapB [Magnetococcales bacterium]|nr:cell division protein ZapB [Magnetococcales bacterium]
MNDALLDHDNTLSTSLTALERRWDGMAEKMRTLREQVASQRQTISELETQVLQQQERIESLEQEKKAVIARIEGLLSRFEEMQS